MSESEAEALSGTGGNIGLATPLRTQSVHMHAWVPLKRRIFRALWMASFISNVGSFMHEVGAAWLMTSLKPVPYMVSLVQAAANLPIFLLALPAGAFADVVDRRKLVICTQSWMFFCTGVLAAFTFAHMTGPWLLLAFTFLLAVGGAMTWPAWQAITPEIVDKSEVPAAIALGGIGFNLSRIVGPALGGFIVGRAGPAAVFLANAISFLAVVGVLFAWKRKAPKRRLPPETIFGAMRSGVRYVKYSPALRSILIRCATVISCAGSMWALLPLLARKEMGLDSTHYGLLLGWLGAGAVIGGLVLPKVRRYVTANELVTISTVMVALQVAALGYVRSRHLVHVTMILGGIMWTWTMLSFNIAVLHSAPEWVRSRAAAIFLLVFTGGQSLASIVWGAVATRYSMPTALAASSVTLLVILAATAYRYRIPPGEKYNLAPGQSQVMAAMQDELEHDEGPVLVLIRYNVRSEDVEDFQLAMGQVRRIRLRDGASQWGLFRDTSAEDLYVETFLVGSWIDHLRQHERMTVDDLAAEKRALAFHYGETAPEVIHYVASG